METKTISKAADVEEKVKVIIADKLGVDEKRNYPTSKFYQ